MGVWWVSGVGRALGLLWGSGIVHGGGWDGCCGASVYSTVGCWVVDVLGMRVGACVDELRLMVLGPGSVGDAEGHSVWAGSGLV